MTQFRLKNGSNPNSPLRITAELPGMNEKDLELHIEDGLLPLGGEKKSETDDKDCAND